MSDLHLRHWPKGLPRHLSIPATNLYANVEIAARRFPDKTFLVFYGARLSFGQLQRQCEAIAGFLQQRCGLRPGDRVLLDMQNSPQFVLAYYGVLRAGGVVVPVNPMNLSEELAHYVADSGARVAFCGQELLDRAQPLLGRGLRHLIVAALGDYAAGDSPIPLPPLLTEPARPLRGQGLVAWQDMLRASLEASPLLSGPDDLAVMPYTSGTTGRPKGCMHTHRNVMSTAVAGAEWVRMPSDNTGLAVLPFFHVTGMQMSLNAALYRTNTVVLLPRWDRDAAAQAVQHWGIGSWHAISTMVVDFLTNPRVADYDLSSVWNMGGGGAAMPDAVAARLQELCGIEYMEGYGMTETMAPTHINPPGRCKRQCLGIPIFDTEARVVDPQSLRELAVGEVGEILVSGPQVMQGYWGQPQASAEAFVELDGRRFLRTGDLGRVDEDGYFFMVDRLKRMINASGYKVWPAEVETLMYQHPDIVEACVVGTPDAHRGETVKAFVVLRPEARGKVGEQQIVDWAHACMAAYKSPRVIEFVDALPKSGTGKVMWRALQERERGLS